MFGVIISIPIGGENVLFYPMLGVSLSYAVGAIIAGFITLDYRIWPPLRIWPGLLILFSIAASGYLTYDWMDGWLTIKSDSDIEVGMPFLIRAIVAGFGVVSVLMMGLLLAGLKHSRKLGEYGK